MTDATPADAGTQGGAGPPKAPAAAVTCRPAVPADVPAVLALIRALAEYERLGHDVVADESALDAALFAPEPRVFCTLAEIEGATVGFALWFFNFSTFLGRHGIYLEDLFVLPAARGCGAGKALLTDLAQRCVREGLGRLEWSVLDWNASAIGFYRACGGEPMDGWTTFRLTGERLARFGAAAGAGR